MVSVFTGVLSLLTVVDAPRLASVPLSDSAGHTASGTIADWGTVALSMTADWCGLRSGQAIMVQVEASDLVEPINAVQAVVAYDHTRLTLVNFLPGDGNGSPWDASFPFVGEVEDGVLVAGVAMFGQTTQDAVVGRIEFTALDVTTAALTHADLLPYASSFETKLTLASTSANVFPALGEDLEIAHAGDWDADGDVDTADHETLAGCLAGPALDYGQPQCCWFDFDGDADVDLADFAEFTQLAGGSSMRASPASIYSWDAFDGPPHER